MIYVIISLLLGFASWGVAILNMKNKNHKKSKYYIVLSFSLCLLSIYSQILLMCSYGESQWSLVIDALDALDFAIPVLMFVTIVLNILSVNNQHKN